MHVDARWSQPRARRQRGVVSDDLPEALSGVAGAHEDPRRTADTLERKGQEALRMRADGVLERAAVDLDGIWDPALEAPCQDRGAHNEVIRERDVGTGFGGHPLHRRDVGLDVVSELAIAELGKGHRLEPLVAIGHVDGEDPADVGNPDVAPFG
jgi:hypothetical protein